MAPGRDALEVLLYPLRDGVRWGARLRWSDHLGERTMRIMGGVSREQLLTAIGAVFDRRSGGTIKPDADSSR